MGRNQQKGATFEQDCADYFTAHGCEVIRKRPHGQNDQGDLHGVRFNGKKVTVECKNHNVHSPQCNHWRYMIHLIDLKVCGMNMSLYLIKFILATRYCTFLCHDI